MIKQLSKKYIEFIENIEKNQTNDFGEKNIRPIIFRSDST